MSGQPSPRQCTGCWQASRYGHRRPGSRRPRRRGRAERNKLTHKHKDLEDLFYAEVRARNGIPASEIKLRERIAAQESTIEALQRKRDGYRAASETFARAVHVLTVENDNLREEVDKCRSSYVTTLPSRR